MNQLLFEGRSLVGMVSSIVNQDDRRIALNRFDWERMYRLSDYHKVANIVYLGLLGYREAVPDKWRERFFKRYQESLQFGEYCEESLKEVLTWLDMMGISCTILTSESVREFYKLPETAENSPIQIFLEEENYYLAKGFLIDLGYEIEETYIGFGERMKRVSGISVTLYRKLPFRTVKYAKGMIKLLETAQIREPYENIWMLPIESELIYRMASVVYRYSIDELTMREVLELFLCHKAWRENLDDEIFWKRLEEFKVDTLSEKILDLAYMWFGEKTDTFLVNHQDDMIVYDIVEERLLTRGLVNHENDDQALKLQNLINKEIEKEKIKEGKIIKKEKRDEYFNKLKKQMKWLFPDYHYMSSIYSILEKIPVLLPVCWIIRGMRIFWRSFVK